MNTMRKRYDFSKAAPNPYAKRLKVPTKIRLDQESLVHFQAAWADERNQREREIESGAVALIDWEALRASLTR